MRFLLIWVSSAGKEEHFILGLLSQNSKKEQEKEQMYQGHEQRESCFSWCFCPQTGTPPFSKATLDNVLLAHVHIPTPLFAL